jgi:hypothetical protein
MLDVLKTQRGRLRRCALFTFYSLHLDDRLA